MSGQYHIERLVYDFAILVTSRRLHSINFSRARRHRSYPTLSEGMVRRFLHPT